MNRFSAACVKPGDKPSLLIQQSYQTAGCRNPDAEGPQRAPDSLAKGKNREKCTLLSWHQSCSLMCVGGILSAKGWKQALSADGTERKETAMSTGKVLTFASMVALFLAPASFAGQVVSVAGEKLDSGLGALSPNYTASEFQRVVVGEKLDSGLGDLPSNYAAAEFQRTVVGQKLDSGLGDLPADYAAAEFQRSVVGEKQDSGLGNLPSSYAAAEFQRSVVGEKQDSGLGELPVSYTAAEFQKTVQAEYRVPGESLDSGLGGLPSSYTAAEFQNKEWLATR
jgi:hypothetical protein